MPSRVIRESILDSESLSQVSVLADLLFRSLILVADDHGRVDGRVPVLRARIFPLRKGVTEAWLVTCLDELCRGDEPPVRRYEVNGRPYLYLTGWEKHASSQRRAKPRFPEPPGDTVVASGKDPEGVDGVPPKPKPTPTPPPESSSSQKQQSGSEQHPEAEPLTSALIATIQRIQPGARVRRAAWQAVVDKMLRLDKRDPVEIHTTIAWLEKENPKRDKPFVVLSANALREKYDNIQAARNANGKQAIAQRHAEWQRELIEQRRRLADAALALTRQDLAPAIHERMLATTRSARAQITALEARLKGHLP